MNLVFGAITAPMEGEADETKVDRPRSCDSRGEREQDHSLARPSALLATERPSRLVWGLVCQDPFLHFVVSPG